jgi:ribonuclease P protein component
MATATPSSVFRLRKHADYQRVYKSSRKQFARQMSYFFAVRDVEGAASPRVGLTVGKVMGKAVDRNRIKRRMREAVRRNLPLIVGLPVDVVLHPKRSVMEMDFVVLEREVAQVFKAVADAVQKPARAADRE